MVERVVMFNDVVVVGEVFLGDIVEGVIVC